MGSRKEDVDLLLVLRDPKCAREWVRTFDWGLTDPPKFMTIDRGVESERVIHFNNMTDEDAVLAAYHLLNDFEIPRIVNFLAKLRGMDLPSIH